jgi:hypothetical protein
LKLASLLGSQSSNFLEQLRPGLRRELLQCHLES